MQTAPLPKPQKPAYLMLLGLSAIGSEICWIPLLLENASAEPSASWASVFLLVLALLIPAFAVWDRMAAAMAAGDRISTMNRYKAGLGGVVGAVLGVFGGR